MGPYLALCANSRISQEGPKCEHGEIKGRGVGGCSHSSGKVNQLPQIFQGGVGVVRGDQEDQDIGEDGNTGEYKGLKGREGRRGA